MLISEISKKHQKSAASEWRDKYSKQPEKSTSESFLPSEQAFSRPADQAGPGQIPGQAGAQPLRSLVFSVNMQDH
ncbi:hypothetical protein WJX82_002452 [Trebouxia sp. C0006]